ncbi:hypothetical protein FIU45_03425 [Enterococcus faecium]|nr:hypothetical protein CWE29_12130 [Enterococcus faecium]EGP5218853.1 hypothetical protein [Enterococcus faecium]EGP5274855.1 hypothetical protein [Enterococcus faecium]OZS36320.1 hypothetical protein CG820_11875 [Enterococcus faecium]PEQ19258.1 hypothetical protein CRN00_08860 [Enterococcus faecium]
MSLPFHSESQGAISKNSFSCLLDLVTCDRGVGKKNIVYKKEVVTSLCHNLFFINFHYFDFVLMPIDRSSIQQ